MFVSVSFTPISISFWCPVNIFASCCCTGMCIIYGYLQKARSSRCSSLWTTHESAGLHREALTQALQRFFTGHSLASRNPRMCRECSCWKGHVRSKQLHTARLSVGSGGPRCIAPGQWIIRRQQSSQSHFNSSFPGLHLLYFASCTTQNPTCSFLNTWK